MLLPVIIFVLFNSTPDPEPTVLATSQGALVSTDNSSYFDNSTTPAAFLVRKESYIENPPYNPSGEDEEEEEEDDDDDDAADVLANSHLFQALTTPSVDIVAEEEAVFAPSMAPTLA